MKRSELRQIIKEEITKVLNENQMQMDLDGSPKNDPNFHAEFAANALLGKTLLDTFLHKEIKITGIKNIKDAGKGVMIITFSTEFEITKVLFSNADIVEREGREDLTLSLRNVEDILDGKSANSFQSGNRLILKK